VNTTLCVAAILGSVLLTSCATTVVRLHGYSAADLAEINRAVRAETSGEILSYRPISTDAVNVYVRGHHEYPDEYLVEHVKGKWQINHKAVVVES